MPRSTNVRFNGAAQKRHCDFLGEGDGFEEGVDMVRILVVNIGQLQACELRATRMPGGMLLDHKSQNSDLVCDSSAD